MGDDHSGYCWALAFPGMMAVSAERVILACRAASRVPKFYFHRTSLSFRMRLYDSVQNIRNSFASLRCPICHIALKDSNQLERTWVWHPNLIHIHFNCTMKNNLACGPSSAVLSTPLIQLELAFGSIAALSDLKIGPLVTIIHTQDV